MNVEAQLLAHMNDLATKLALVAASSGVLAVVGFVLCSALAFFEPCRRLYRTHQAVQGSLACQSYSAISLFSLLLSLAAVAFAVAAVAVALLSWRAASGNNVGRH